MKFEDSFFNSIGDGWLNTDFVNYGGVGKKYFVRIVVLIKLRKGVKTLFMRHGFGITNFILKKKFEIKVI